MNISDKIKILKNILPEINKNMESCELCLRKCGINRKNGEKGYCSAGESVRAYSYSPHFGEEPLISGRAGSGTIFFSHCNMGCVYCQNYIFSHEGRGKDLGIRELSGIMLKLQSEGCHNINLVSPTHFVPQILQALLTAYEKGLKLPVVYNTGGYDSPEVIGLLGGIIDIYLLDMRYAEDGAAVKYSDAPAYSENNRAILKKMYEQVGNIQHAAGLAFKGVIVRLLIMPGNVSGVAKTLEFLKQCPGKDIYLSLMSQYYPAYKAKDDDVINRRISAAEYRKATKVLKETGFSNGWIQEFEGEFDKKFAGENFTPNI